MSRTNQWVTPAQPTGQLVISDQSGYQPLSRHPFDDGSGRAARTLTNAELVAHDQARIVVTNSYRGNYLAGLTAASANGNGRALVSVLDFTRRWVGAVDWSDWDRCMADLTSSNAFIDSVVAERSGERLRLPGPS